jgi:acyl-CoA-binding protein
MANLIYNRIDTVILETTIESIKTNLHNISSQLPSLALTTDEKKSFRGMDAANKAFVEDCINLLRSNGAETMPSYIKIDNLIADLKLFEQLDILKSIVNQVTSQINAAQRLAGKEAYDTALKVYELYETASKSGVQGSKTSFEKLNQRFKTNTGRKSDTQLKRKQH